ncbi:carbohydrate ABC transporter permease [Verminephrobacter aporrectodeae]|uniref:Sugar ABC transporter permease n=1 Tax=Verminephrobacter aporrectodeae subsp. tuberculatae TaxID=1110392 RepID=A0ABT3KZG7_9BURK|nr:sugar ABC transporter permease [Verminephrobacter aporrectodeae]MCW5223449.1 sugar ABC transporter permease [Verminephrobacter aporrectodeae subsp. tuberculatae]MCW5256345.1 sugar ABC transporter permease [Verminephrobacter aporrectodeae subsp. tuberculatae]MCW5288913.1 sugar ABC transporter permease [Verminephrobacter aporrectodeae subsp. tuberculatae]MCW5323299.1 sugar ABC transporter permease [Verminephrobacter aporrectodeae subsp. tuberculatae]MCW8174309.1 sugar ABC transporter permease
MPHRFQNQALLLPVVLFLLLMLGFPTLLNIVYSFSEISFENLRSPRLSGWENYAEVLRDDAFWQSLGFSLRFGLGSAIAETALGFFLAIFLAPLIRQHRWTLAILMMPMMVAPSMMGLMYRLVLHEFVGPIPYYWELYLGSSPSFLGTEWAFSTIFLIEVLQWTPFTLLLFYMAYEAIPRDMCEAAAVDGTRPWRMFWAIEAPQLLPTLVIALLIRCIDGFRVFDNIYVLMGSGPGGSTMSLSIYIYESFFKSAQLGKALAASILLFLAAFGLLYASSRLIRRGAKA